MDSPIATVKSAINPGNIIKAVIGFVVIAAIFDLIGMSDLLFRPYSYVKGRFFSTAP